MIKYEVHVDDYGTKEWFLNGKLHREDGPAIEYADGIKFWYLNGKRHREDGPAVEHADGTKFWYMNGKRHREDGPAVEHADGYKSWFLNGKLHREDGPAIEWVDGCKEWYLNGEELTENDWKKKTQKAKEMTVAEISKPCFRQAMESQITAIQQLKDENLRCKECEIYWSDSYNEGLKCYKCIWNSGIQDYFIQRKPSSV